ncbi:MAG TPA: hypothetical protein VEC17_01485 [Candidatus Binatia bacterium]|nr:hypothetical protein [Candidatus Binatia bacterium]
MRRRPEGHPAFNFEQDNEPEKKIEQPKKPDPTEEFAKKYEKTEHGTYESTLCTNCKVLLGRGDCVDCHRRRNRNLMMSIEFKQQVDLPYKKMFDRVYPKLSPREVDELRKIKDDEDKISYVVKKYWEYFPEKRK